MGTGWIGWTYEQTLNTPMQAIATAHKGRMAMLREIFGGNDPAKPKPEAEKLTPKLFKSMFGKGG